MKIAALFIDVTLNNLILQLIIAIEMKSFKNQGFLRKYQVETRSKLNNAPIISVNLIFRIIGLKKRL